MKNGSHLAFRNKRHCRTYTHKKDSSDITQFKFFPKIEVILMSKNSMNFEFFLNFAKLGSSMQIFMILNP